MCCPASLRPHGNPGYLELLLVEQQTCIISKLALQITVWPLAPHTKPLHRIIDMSAVPKVRAPTSSSAPSAFDLESFTDDSSSVQYMQAGSRLHHLGDCS